MKKEEALLVAICSSYFNSTPLTLSTDIDYNYLYTLASHHNLPGICHCILYDKDGAPDDFLRTLKSDFEDYIFSYQCQCNIKSELSSLLSAGSVRHVFFKGAVIRELYPVPEARAMGDIDVLIDEENRDKVKKLLTVNGFVCTAKNGQVYDYVKGNVLIEVHTNLMTEYGRELFSSPFDFTDTGDFCRSLDSDYHLAYMIAHTANHMKNSGAGVRFILDLAVWQRQYEINYDKLLDMLERINLTTFGKALLSVCNKWFGVGRDFDADTERLEEYIVSYGVFGTLKDSKGSTVSRLIQLKALGEDDKGLDKSSLQLKLKLAFPSYELLRRASYINFLDGKPYLLPLAWGYRFFYNLKNHRHHMLETIKNVDDEKTAALAKEELEFFKEIGII